MTRRNLLGRAFDLLASVKVAIPLLVLIAAASIAGSFIPQGRNVDLTAAAPDGIRRLNQYLQLNDVFHSWWFLLLLVLLGLSLLAVTVKRIPATWKQRGRGPGLGILLAHLGILLILGGMIYGGLSGFRYYTHLIEGEVTVVPSLPFVIKLDRFDLTYYSPGSAGPGQPRFRRIEKQDSTFTLFHHGSPFLQATAAPGRPVSARGITLLPAQKDIGRAFDLVLEAGGREKVVPIRPWAPPLITLGLGNPSQILAHRLTGDGPGPEGTEDGSGSLATEVFLLQADGTSRSLGFAGQSEPLQFGAWTISVGAVRRHTGVHIYSRPEKPILMAGIVVLMVGLAGYFTGWGRWLLPGTLHVETRKSAPGSSG
jgi:hypothetical protein